MDSTVVKKTQDTLGKVIKKPPLTEKLLSKPPFRFLHDIVTEVIKANGFFKGLFKTEELNSANVKDRDAKIAFLQKAIDVVVFVTGESLSIRPSKVVAGHEPEKTNEFLQLLGKACLKKLDSQEGIKKVLSGEKPGSGSSSKRKESRTKSSKDKDKEKLNEKENKPAVENGVNQDTVNEDEPELRRKSSSSSRVHSSDKIKHKEKDSKERESKGKTRGKSKDRDKSERESAKSGKDKKDSKEKLVTSKSEVVSNGDLEVPSDIVVGDGSAEGDDDAYNRNIPRPSSAKGQRRRPKNEDGEDSDEELDEGEQHIEQVDKTDSNENIELNGLAASPSPARRKLARPSSARPAPPRKKRQQEEQEDTIAKLGPTTQVSNVIVDNKDDEEDDTFLVEEAPAPSITQDMQTHNDESDLVEDGTEGEHGALVKKMLETKKELEGTSQKSKQDILAKPLMNDAHRRKQREHAQKEIDKLRESIQTLCRSANPLGKIMDYIQEDMDSMQKELEMWREENKQHQIALKREQSITENEIEPLKSHLTNMETDVTEMLDRISTVKCNILRNEEKIQTLLAGVSFS